MADGCMELKPVFGLINRSNPLAGKEPIHCERFEPRSHFKSRLSLIVQVNVVLNRTVVIDSDPTVPDCDSLLVCLGPT